LSFDHSVKDTCVTNLTGIENVNAGAHFLFFSHIPDLKPLMQLETDVFPMILKDILKLQVSLFVWCFFTQKYSRGDLAREGRRSCTQEQQKELGEGV